MMTRLLFSYFLLLIFIACQPMPSATATSRPTPLASATLLPPATVTLPTNASPTAVSTPTVTPAELKRRAGPICENAFSALVESGPLAPPFAVLKKMEYADTPSWDVSHPLPHLGSLSASAVKTLFCVSETRAQTGTYTDGSPAYQFFWEVRAISWPGGKVIGKNTFTGSTPPEINVFLAGFPEGLSPYKEFAAWFFNQVEHPSFLYFNDAITSLALSRDGQLAAFGTAIANQVVDGDYQAKIFLFNPSFLQTEVGTASFLDVLDGHQGMVTSLAFSPEGNMLASSGYDRFIKFWDMVSGRLSGQVNVPDTPNFLSFSPDGSKLVVASDLEVTFLNSVSMETEKSIPVSSGGNLVFSPDGNLVYVSTPFNITVIDSNAGTAILEFPDPSALVPTTTVTDDGTIVSVTYETPNVVDNFALSPDGTQIATYTVNPATDTGPGGENVRLATWDAKSGKYKSEINFFAESIQAMKFSSDGTRLALGNGNEIWVWDTSAWQMVKRLSGHVDLVEDLTFTPDGKTIISASRDGTIRSWSLDE
jgi:WD40 repeat protein